MGDYKFSTPLLGLLLFVLVGCGVPINKYDETMSLMEQETNTVYYDYNRSSEIQVRLTHISGTPVTVYALTKAEFNNYQSGRRWRYLTALTSENIRNRFESRWARPNYNGLLYFVLRPTDIQDGNWTRAKFRFEIDVKLSPQS